MGRRLLRSALVVAFAAPVALGGLSALDMGWGSAPAGVRVAAEQTHVSGTVSTLGVADMGWGRRTAGAEPVTPPDMGWDTTPADVAPVTPPDMGWDTTPADVVA